MGLAGPLQNDHRDLPRGPALVLLESGHALGMSVVQLAPLGPFRYARVRLESVQTDLDGDARIREEVAIPVGVGRSAALGCDDDEMIGVTGIGQRIGALFSGFRAARRQQKER